jgi:hypothetical protein
LAALRGEDLHRYRDRVVIEARVRAPTGACRRCGQVSGRVHGGYVRQLRDAAAGGVQVVILLRVRRFRCGNAAFPVVTFAEQVEGLTSPGNRIRVVAESTGTFYGTAMTAGNIYTVAGLGPQGFSGDGGPAIKAALSEPFGVAVNSTGDLLIADIGNNRIRMVNG